MHKEIQRITKRVIERSAPTRLAYLKKIEASAIQGPHRKVLSCGNLAHGFAACSAEEKDNMRAMHKANIAIISSYNDLLSAHQPYESYPALLKKAIQDAGGIAQFAGGVPAMCDGITQGQAGMDLSLLSRDVIALSTSVALSHNLFDGGLLLGICDKIVPGLLIAALRFGHLPFLFVPAGPMPSGISNQEKARIRQLYSEKKVDKDSLLDAEAASYHSPGTCTFYGTANSNQLLLECMGLQLPGSSFIHPYSPLRSALSKAAAKRVLHLTAQTKESLSIGELVSEKTMINAMVGLLASGGSTNHTMHLVAIARAAGIQINWDDFADLSKVTPLIVRVYPNGEEDINAFERAGGMAFLIRSLLEAELLHPDVDTVAGYGLERYTQKPVVQNGTLQWVDGPMQSSNPAVLTDTVNPFIPQGGMRVLSGNVGRAILKTSALKEACMTVEAPAVIFSSQEAFVTAFESGDLNRDCVVVLRFQGPRARGMPELHKLTPLLGVLQDRGYRVALITDGRMSGASGKIPAAIHVSPEALCGGNIARIQDGDMIMLDGIKGVLQVMLPDGVLAARPCAVMEDEGQGEGMGRELFAGLRHQLSSAEEGACSLFVVEDERYASSQ